METPSRINNFDLARLFGALLVIYGHSYPLSGAVSPGFAANGVATIGVKIFFSISGYLIAKSWLRDPDVFRFFARRAVRIFPALIVVVLLSAFVLGPLVSRLPAGAYYSHPTTLFYLNNIGLYINYSLPGVFETNIYPHAVNGSLWSLPVEVFMYLATPLLLALVVWADVRFFALIFIAITTASMLLINVYPRSGQWVVYATDVWSGLSLTPYFVCGMLFAVCKLDRFFNIYVAFGALFALAIVEVNGAVKELMLILILPYAVLSFSVGAIPGLHRFPRGVDLSYGMFLYGFPVQQTIVSTFGPQTPWRLFVVSTLISAVLAFLSWHLVEKRALQWKPKALPPATESDPVAPLTPSPVSRFDGRKNLALEGLRGLACLNVVIGHFLFAFFPYLASFVRPYPGATSGSRFEHLMSYPPFTFSYMADAAVSIFFVLSGYVLTSQFYATGRASVFENAATKRFVRLVLPAFCSVMFAWLLLVLGLYANQQAPALGAAGWIMAFYNEPVSFVGAVFRGLIAAPLFGRNDLNTPLWTIQVELIGSMLLFACYALFGTRNKLLLVFWFSFFALVISSRFDMLFSKGNSEPLYYLSILAGSLLHVVEDRLRRTAQLALVCLVAGLICVSFSYTPAFALFQAVRLPDLSPYGPDMHGDLRVFWHSVGAVLLVAGVIGSSGASRVLAHPALVYLGRISFALYLLHFPVILSLSIRTAQWGKSLGLGYVAFCSVAFVVTMAVLFALSELFYRWIDRPSKMLADRFAERPVVHRGLPAVAEAK